MGDDPVFDVDILQDTRAVVTPTKGSLVPGWLLVIPRIASISFKSLINTERKNCLSLAKSLASALQNSQTQPFYFEHGPIHQKTKIGCGVDQAHLHVVSLPFDLMYYTMQRAPHLDWQLVDTSDPWEAIEPGRPYYLMSNFDSVCLCYPSEEQSQFFRRIIAEGLGAPEEWDYNSYPHRQKARETHSMISRNELCAA